MRIVSLAVLLICCWQQPVLAEESTPVETGSAYNTSRDISYAPTEEVGHEFQTLDVYWQDNQEKRPVILFVHGGGWAFGQKEDVGLKPAYFVPNGFAMVSMNLRLRWEFDVYDQLEDIATVTRWIKDQADTYGLDADRIILMGHASGAHLVSLVGTDERYLKAADMSFANIAVVVAIDTLSFDIPRVMTELGSFIERRHHAIIFGDDEEVWTAASPITYVEADKKIPAFALMYVADSEATSVQTKAFAKALAGAKVEAILIPGNEKTAQSIDEELGRSDDPSTQALMTFMRLKI